MCVCVCESKKGESEKLSLERQCLDEPGTFVQYMWLLCDVLKGASFTLMTGNH